MSTKTTTTVRLPDFCERHGKYCAYTGLEPGRCALCHMNNHATDEHGDPWDGGRKRPCQCASCLEYFTSPSAHGHHIRHMKCTDPEAHGLILVEQEDGWTLWGWPGDMPEGIHK